jgi:hypothetical protein
MGGRKLALPESILKTLTGSEADLLALGLRPEALTAWGRVRNGPKGPVGAGRGWPSLSLEVGANRLAPQRRAGRRVMGQGGMRVPVSSSVSPVMSYAELVRAEAERWELIRGCCWRSYPPGEPVQGRYLHRRSARSDASDARHGARIADRLAGKTSTLARLPALHQRGAGR